MKGVGHDGGSTGAKGVIQGCELSNHPPPNPERGSVTGFLRVQSREAALGEVVFEVPRLELFSVSGYRSSLWVPGLM